MSQLATASTRPTRSIEAIGDQGVKRILVVDDEETIRLAIGKFLSTPRDVFKQACDISAYSLIGLARAAAPLMASGGSIIAMTYLGSEKAVPGYNVMGVAKAALESSARYLALELGEKKIRVNGVCPGWVEETGGVAALAPEVGEILRRNSPMRRNVSPADVANLVAFLCSPESEMVVGQTIIHDGGVSLLSVFG